MNLIYADMLFIGILQKPWMATLETSITAALAHTRTLHPPTDAGTETRFSGCSQPTDRKEYNGIEKETETHFQHAMAEARKRPRACQHADLYGNFKVWIGNMSRSDKEDL
jgi:hypothetical protein